MVGIEHAWQRIFVALDTTDVGRAVELAHGLKGAVGGVKLGKEFFTAHGPDGVHRVIECGMPLFLDLKYHDIPNTVAGAIRAALPLNPFIVNVHAGGGRRMMEAAAKAADEATGKRPSVIGVTVLTSMTRVDMAEVLFEGDWQSPGVSPAKAQQTIMSAEAFQRLCELFPPKLDQAPRIRRPGAIRPEYSGRDNRIKPATRP